MADIEAKAHPLLYVDDEQDNLDAFRFSFRRHFDVRTALGPQAALAELAQTDVAVLVVDQRMPGMSGLELLVEAQKVRPEAVGIILTAYSDIQVLIDALNSGLVYRYVSKPWDSQELKVILRQAVERHALFRENRELLARLEELNSYLQGEIVEQLNAGEMIGESPALSPVLEAIRTVAPTDTSVLVRGESGTGKELVARAVHANSLRAAGPFVRVACAALSPGLLESELFGHEKGAFTGAHERRLGRFELAQGGTLLLDEVGDLPEGMQVKLLRVLQEREFERVGGNRTLKLDTRIIAATHRNLEALIAEGRFREDLYFRLNVFPVYLPPLRERPEDIPLLVDHFICRFARKLRRPASRLHPRALELLLRYGWPGNVRELENLIERAVILSRGPVIGPELVQLTPPSPASGQGLSGGWARQPTVSRGGGAETPAAAPAGWGSDVLPAQPPEPGSSGAHRAAGLHHPPGPGHGGNGHAPPSVAGRWQPPGAAAASPLGEQLEDLERRELVRALDEARGSKAEAARILGINRSTLYYRLKKHGLVED